MSVEEYKNEKIVVEKLNADGEVIETCPALLSIKFTEKYAILNVQSAKPMSFRANESCRFRINEK